MGDLGLFSSDLELGKKGKWGTLANRESRAAFLSDPRGGNLAEHSGAKTS